MTRLELRVLSPLGGTFEVTSTFVIGREPQNDLVLADPLVSRQHAEITWSPEQSWVIRDLGSSHGTFVDGRRTTCVKLDGRGEIRIGGCRLAFDTDPVERHTTELGTARVAQRLRVDADPRFLRGAEIEDPAILRRDYDRLRVAYELSRSIALEHDATRLPLRLLTAVIELLEADRGALIILNSDGSIKSQTYAAAEGIAEMTHFSQTILKEVVRTRAALICDDVAQDQLLSRSSSVYSSGVRSVMCVPIVYRKEALGVIEIDCVESPREFGDEDLEIFSAIATQAGLALMNLKLFDERREQEARAAHAERLALIGRLAGGIAHDFNNLMSVVMSYGEILREEAPKEMKSDADVIVDTARRAGALTRQLLTFSRKDLTRPQNVSVSSLVKGLHPLLKRTLGDAVEIEVDAEAKGLIREDPGRVEQVLMNLAVNARDAMPKGGKIKISCLDRVLRAPEARGDRTLPAGAWLEVSVTDSGTGIPPEVLSRIFEPFFTTKEAGRGTGLGLATVLSIVESSGGHIFVDTTPGKGTTFTVAWPVAPAKAAVVEAPSTEQRWANGSGTILVAEDEDGVREAVRRILTAAGYKVITAPHGEAAWSILEKERPEIGLLLTDITMPRMSGVELARRSRDQRPSVPVLYITGFQQQEDAERLTGDVLEKPFSADQLLTQVRRAMGHAKAKSA